MRHQYPEDEKKRKWLPTLLDSYELADAVDSELLQNKMKQGIKTTCSIGCSLYCKMPSVPFIAPELMGISWSASEKLSGPNRAVMKQQLRTHEITIRRPFLIEDGCPIYPVRPLACR